MIRGLVRALASLANLALMFALVLVVALVWLLGTTTGARWLAEVASEQVAGFQAEVTDGSIWRGLSVTGLAYRADGIDVRGDRVAFRWRPECALAITACLDAVTISGVRVDVDTAVSATDATAAEPPPADAPGRLDLPVTIRLDTFRLRDAVVTVDGNRVRLDALDTSLRAGGDRVAIGRTRIEGVAVSLAAGGATAAAQPPRVDGDTPPPPDSALALPVDVSLEALELRNVAFSAEGAEVRLDALETALRAADDRVDVGMTRVAGLDVSLVTEASEASEASEAPPVPEPAAGAAFTLPLEVSLEGISLRDASVRVDGNRVRLRALDTSLRAAGRRVDVGETRVDGVDIRLPEPLEPVQTPTAEADPVTAVPETSPLPEALPEVALPLDVDIELFRLTDVRVRRGDLDERLEALTLVAGLERRRLRIDELSLVHARGTARLAGDLELAGDWPLALELDADIHELPDGLGRQRVRSTLDGSVAEPELTLEASGALSVRLEAGAALLDRDLPWRLMLDAERLQWPLDGSPQVTVSDLSVRSEGVLASYELALSADVAGADIPSGSWTLNAEGDERGARIESLRGDTLEGRMDLSGEVGWDEEVRWDLVLNADGLVLDRYAPELEPRLGGEIAVAGSLVDDQWRVDVDIRGVDGRVGGNPLALRGRVSRNADDVWSIPELALDSGPNRVRVDGSLDDAWDARVVLELPELAALWPGLAGRLSADLTLAGPRLMPTVTGEVSGTDVGFEGNNVERLSVEARVVEGLRGDSRVRLRASGIEAADQRVGEVVFVFEGRLDRHELDLIVDSRQGGLDFRLAGGLDEALQDWNGRMTEAQIMAPDGVWRLRESFSLAWSGASRRARAGEHCWVRDPATLCITEPVEAGADYAVGALTLERYDLVALQPWLPADVLLQASVDAEARIRWDGEGRPRVQASASSRDGVFGMLARDADDALRLDYQALTVDAELADEQARLSLDLASETLGRGRVRLTVDPFASVRRMDGEVALEGLDISAARLFLPQLQDLAGEVSVEGQVTGALDAPEFDGEVRLERARVAVREPPVEIDDIAVSARIQGQGARIRGGFRMGEGEARLGGEVEWSDGLQATMAFSGERLTLSYPPYARLALSPALSFAVTPGEVSVNGRLAIPDGQITVDSLPAQAVRVSSDVVVVDRPEPEDTAEPWAINSNVTLVLGDDLRFSGFGAEGRLAGALQLRQVGTDGATAAGDIRFEDGRFQAYGQRLQIRRGQFLFAGPITEPRLDIEAVRTVDEVLVGLRITGPASAPEAAVFSEPPMPQESILAYLITGRAPGGGGPSEQQVLTQAAMSLGILGGQGVGSAVAEQFGVDDFRLEADGQGEDTQVAVSGYIAPNLMVRYGVGVFQPENTLTLRYYLSQRLYLEAVSGFESALDLFYSFDF